MKTKAEWMPKMIMSTMTMKPMPQARRETLLLEPPKARNGPPHHRSAVA